MRILLLSMWLCIAAAPVFANPGGIPNGGVGQGIGVGNSKHAAPAPLLGAGIPAAMAVGGAFLGAKLLGRRKR